MTRTEHCQLPQWEVNDPVRREDFNEAMERIDAAIQGITYAVGSYTGNGKTMENGGLFVELGFRPRFVIVSCGWVSVTYSPSTFFVVGESVKSGVDTVVTFEATGFRVAEYGNLAINDSDIAYSYVAFR